MANDEYKNSEPFMISGRLGFASILVPKASKQNKERLNYRAALILPNGSEQVVRLMERIEKQVIGFFGKTAKPEWAKIKSEKIKRCFADGNDIFDNEGNVTEGFADTLIYTALGRENRPPVIFDDVGNAVKPSDKAQWQQEARKFYRGCYVNMVSKIWIQDGVNSGVRSELIAIQFDKDGDRLSSDGEAPDVSSLFGAKKPQDITSEATPIAKVPFGSAPSFVDDEE